MISYIVNRDARVEIVVTRPADADTVTFILTYPDGFPKEVRTLNAADARRLGQELVAATDHLLANTITFATVDV